MDNPFVLMFSKEPKHMIKRPAFAAQILNDFTNEEPNSQIYMITGVRGSGKTVFMTSVSNMLKQEGDWIIINLNAYTDLLPVFAGKLYKETVSIFSLIKPKIKFQYDKVGVEFETKSVSEIETDITEMLEEAQKKHKKVLIKIDEASNTSQMRVFASSFNIWVSENLPVFLIMTGLPENIDALKNNAALTFLYRAPRIHLGPLDMPGIANTYYKVFGNKTNAIEMAKLTKGYAYAFQVLGYYTYENYGNYNAAINKCCDHLFDYVYEKLWSELSKNDKKLIIGTVKSKTDNVKDILDFMKIEHNQLSPYRDRLIKKGIISSETRGRIVFTLPFFDAFVVKKIELLEFAID